jgi:phosphoenolpyruvate carboxylase
MGVVTPFQQMSLNDRMHREIGSLWQSDEVSRVKPTPQFEAERGTLVVETVLWEALPTYLRKLDATMRHTLGTEYGLPLDAQPIKISSWMGGDRDGNPNVTPNVTREVCLANRAKAARLFRQDLTSLATQLSITNCSDELRQFLGSDAREPYKEFLKPVRSLPTT